MPKTFTDETKHYREAIVEFDYREVERILAEHAMIHLSFSGNFKVKLVDQTVGSPEYKIGTKAIVTINQNLLEE